MVRSSPFFSDAGPAEMDDSAPTTALDGLVHISLSIAILHVVLKRVYTVRFVPLLPTVPCGELAAA